MRGISLCVFFCLAVTLASPGPTSAQPALARDEIPQNMDPDVRRLVEGLYSKDPIERGKSAALLGYGGARSSPAIPYLISILGDETQLKWIGNELYSRKMPYPGILSSPGEEAQKALVRIGRLSISPLINALKDLDPVACTRAAQALKTITGNEFGADEKKWREWWDENKASYPQGFILPGAGT